MNSPSRFSLAVGRACTERRTGIPSRNTGLASAMRDLTRIMTRMPPSTLFETQPPNRQSTLLVRDIAVRSLAVAMADQSP